jgi:tetratricopeptide (TPR) repeat protein
VGSSDWFEAEQHVERAHEAYEAGRWDEAETALRAALSLNPYQVEWHFNLGLTLEAAGRYPEAVRAFKDAFDLHPEDAAPALMVGVNLLRSEQTEEALGWLEKAGALDPKNISSFVHRIQAYTELGQHEQAEVMFYMAQELDAENADALALMADSLLDRALYDKAVWCLREAARLDPELSRVKARLAEAYARTGRHERARQLYLLELRDNPGDIDTLLDLGALLVEMNRFVEAGEKFRRILEIEPDNADAHYELGDLAQRERNPAQARVHFDVVLRLDAAYPGARRRLARLLLDSGSPADQAAARELLWRDVAEQRSEGADWGADALDELGQLLLDAGIKAEAVRVFQQLVEERPGEAIAHHRLSVAYFETGNIAQGQEAARRALRLDPRFIPAMHNMAVACMHQRQWDRARYWARQALLIDGDDQPIRRLRMQLRYLAIASTVGAVYRFFVRRRPPATST